ncbi:plastocyanin/azurin family copper-binding protein [Microbacteriaceae bacterium 4G12]
MKHNALVLRYTAVLTVVGSLGLAGCSNSAGNATTMSAEPAATVIVTDMDYQQTEVTIQAGETVEWVFDDGNMPHDVAGEGELKGELQSPLLTEDTFSYTFEEPGTYTYHCTPHPWMVGTVIVEG